jgi:hypothetical protein
MQPHFQSLLDRLQRLDQSAPDFPDQISKFLSSEEYRECVVNIQADDAATVALVTYLDKVRSRFSLLLPAHATIGY